MRGNVALGLVLVVLVALVASPAGAAKVKHPSDLTYPKLKLETPGYEEIEFANGMKGFFIEDHEIPVVDIHMLISTSRAPREKTGLDDLTAWAIRNGGTANWPADKINEELEFVAASIEVRGGGRRTDVSVNCLKKDLELCLSILGDLLKNPAFPDDKIALRRETMLENIRRENDEPRRIAMREFSKVVYGDHPMGWEPTEETVTAITRDDLVAYHETFFRPNNTLIGISGDVTRDEIMSALGAALEGWDAAPVAIEPEPELTVSFTPSVNYAEKETNQGVIMIGHLGANTHDANLPAIRIMNFILGGGSFTSRITQKVRTDEGLAYAAYSRYGDDPWTRGLFAASSQTRSDATARAISLIIDLIRQMHDEGPTEDEVERAKDTYLNNHVFDYESKSRVVYRLLELAWEGMPLDTPERDIETIENLTVDDVRAAAAEYLHPEGLAILVVGEQSTFDQPLSNFGEVNVIQLEE
jgi:zinc protease